jgi:hypothetical protein
MMTSLLLAAILPAAAVFVLLELARRRWNIAALPILAPAAGYAAAYLVLFRGIPWPARESRHWLFWSGLAIGLVALAAARKTSPPPRRQFWILLLLMQAGLFFQLAPLFHQAWSAREAVLWVFGIVCTLFVLGTALLRLSMLLSTRAFLLLATGSFALLAPLLLVSGTLSLAQLAGGAASALGGVLLFTWRQPLPGTPALAWMCAYFLASLLAQGRFYAGLKNSPLALALLALPAAAWIAVSWKGPRLQPSVFAAAWGLAAAAVALAACLSEPLEY